MKNYLFILVLLSFQAHAIPSGIYTGTSHAPVTIDEIVHTIAPGSIVILGENHGLKSHQLGQLATMQELRDQGRTVATGLEFFNYPDQAKVNAWRAGLMEESIFLKQIAWGSIPFYLYRAQALFPQDPAYTIALNAPKWLTSKIAKSGLDSLSNEERTFLPPQFSLGRPSYKERFLAMMPHLPSPEAADRYFAAQSTWDDTMAWQAVTYMQAHPDQVLVIVVGNFHVDFGGGLPDRIRARAKGIPVITFSQINTFGLSAEELTEEMAVNPAYGARADYLWLSEEKSAE